MSFQYCVRSALATLSILLQDDHETASKRQTFVLVQQASAYKPFQNTYGANWEASGLPSLPLDIRLTDAAGHVVVAT